MPPTATDAQDTRQTPDQVRRGRRIALLLFALGFGPMILATVMFYTGWFNPAGLSNHGELVQPPVGVAGLNLVTLDGTPLEDRFGPEVQDGRWLLLVSAGQCAADCEQLLYLARQVNIALGKHASRVHQAAWLAQVPDDLASRWPGEYSATERLTLRNGARPAWPGGIDPARQPRILVVDPFGNIMMHYGVEHTGNEMLDDLKHLLKLSQIG